jgi:hypothetical protein
MPLETPPPTPTVTSPIPTPTPTCAGDECLPQIYWLLSAQATQEAAYTQFVETNGEVVVLRREYTDADRAGPIIDMAIFIAVLAAIALLILRRGDN